MLQVLLTMLSARDLVRFSSFRLVGRAPETCRLKEHIPALIRRAQGSGALEGAVWYSGKPAGRLHKLLCSCASVFPVVLILIQQRSLSPHRRGKPVLAATFRSCSHRAQRCPERPAQAVVSVVSSALWSYTSILSVTGLAKTTI